MKGRIRFLVLMTLAVTTLAVPLQASADDVDHAVSTFTYTQNMHPLGFSAREVPFTSGIFNSDLAFWERTAVQGTYEGFRLIDVSDPEEPTQIVNFTGCVGGTTTGNQGDVIVWDNIVVRSWNSPTPAGGRFCGDIFTPAGQEGLHVFDISNPAAPDAVAFVPTPCGSHTATGVPDVANGRLLVYNSSSSGTVGCRGIDIVQVPLATPSAASYLRFERSGDTVGLPNLVTVTSGPAAGTYEASGATFGPAPTPAGFSGPILQANDGVGAPSDGCEPFTVSAGAIALVDRGNCDFNVKAINAQNGGAGALVVVNNVPGPPTTMGGTNPNVVIPSVMVSQADGATIRAGLPANGRVSSNPPPAVPERSCHDTGVILGDALRVACAGGNGITVWSLDPAEGGSLEDPQILYSRAFQGVTIGHAATFTWDGEYIVFGHEPGGGTQARCQATSSEVDRTLFFVDAATGATAGTFVHPRPQTSTENCTWHNFNVVPSDRRYLLVAGNYQSGVSVVDFTDPTSAQEIAFADPAPLSDTTLVAGGDWSTYWYDGRIYESDMRRGLIIWNLSGPAAAGARRLGHLNPQTQERSFPLRDGN